MTLSDCICAGSISGYSLPLVSGYSLFDIDGRQVAVEILLELEDIEN